jgi:Bacterial membrane protein YfhO
MNPTWLYVAALYVLAVWVARRAGVDLPVRVALFFYALVLIFLFRPMTQHYVNLPVDIVLTLPPWHGVTPKFRVANFEMNDIVMQIVPWAHQVREAWRHGSVPLWNSLAGCGYPLLANGQSSGFSPIRLLALPLPLGWAFTAEAALKMLIAMTFAFLYGRRRGWSELPSVVAAVCFGFCTFVQTWLHFPLVTVACFLPAVFLHVDLFFEGVTWRRVVFAITLWSIMFFGGHPETCAHAAFLAGLYVMWIVAVERPRAWRENLRVIGAIAGAGTLAVIIAAPFLAPFLEAVSRSQRFQELQIYPNAIGYYSDLPSEVILFQPQFYGHVPYEKAWGPAVAESITGFAGIFGIASWIALLLRAVITRRLRDRELFFVVAAPIVLGIVLAWPVISTSFHALFKLAANARLRLLLCWCAAVMTGTQLDALLRERRTWPLFAGIGVVLASMLKLMHYLPFPGDAARDTAIIAFVPSMLVLVLSLFFAVPLRFRSWTTMALLAAIVAELWTATAGWNPTLPQGMSYPTTPLIAKLRELRGGDGPAKPYRFVGLGPALFPNANALFGLEDVRAHDPMANGDYLGFLRVLESYNTSDYFAKWNNAGTPLLDFLNVKYVVSAPGYDIPDKERFHEVYSGKDGAIFENANVLPRFFAPRSVIVEGRRETFAKALVRHTDWANIALVERPVGARIGPPATVTLQPSSDSDFRMNVRASHPALIVSSITWFPGWRVTHNGRSLEATPVNGPFLGFTVPAGEGEVRVHYAPASFYGGLAASLLTIASLVVTGVRLRRRPRAAAG